MNTPKRPRFIYRYKNLGKASKVLKYEIRKDAVTIRFTDNTEYIYTNQTAGPENIAKMKTLAQAGKGLGTFIESTVKERWLRKVH